MSRLRHSEKALIRSLQLSRTDVFVFVEGWTDRYFYDKGCKVALNGLPRTYELRLSRELAAGGEGKHALLNFFSYLRGRKLLFHEFKGKKLAVIFFLDKDVDDFLRIRKRSKHLVYTQYYAVENYFVRHSDLGDALAAAACLDADSVRAILGNQDAWSRRAATEWKDWVGLCLLARAVRANAPSNYGRHSQVNVGAYGGVIPGSVMLMEGEIQAASGLPAARFQQISARVNRFVARMFAIGLHDRLFKGEWYGFFLVEDARRAAAGRPHDPNGLANRTFAVASSKLDFLQPWAEHLFHPVREIAEMF
jgi:hypothetical protein